MADTPNPEDLAKLYLEFWRQPLAGLTRDPQVAESIARMFDLMTAGAATFAKIVAGAEGPGARAKGSPDTAGVSPKNDARPNRGASSDARGEQPARLDQIARRVAELERRIARLEPRASARRTRAQSRPRRPRRPTQ
ncbi:MAG: hypothetical protein EXR02_02725 [Rhodospirillales bacterium]|nr:hypothetical protein [Rhodospirillales bacterium]MSP79964.1 hypothetical protein [Rhodospirillales bacterium]